MASDSDITNFNYCENHDMLTLGEHFCRNLDFAPNINDYHFRITLTIKMHPYLDNFFTRFESYKNKRDEK